MRAATDKSGPTSPTRRCGLTSRTSIRPRPRRWYVVDRMDKDIDILVPDSGKILRKFQPTACDGRHLSRHNARTPSPPGPVIRSSCLSEEWAARTHQAQAPVNSPTIAIRSLRVLPGCASGLDEKTAVVELFWPQALENDRPAARGLAERTLRLLPEEVYWGEPVSVGLGAFLAVTASPDEPAACAVALVVGLQRWARDAGLRLDALLLSPDLAVRLRDAGVDRAVRGEEGASDHAPAWIRLARRGRNKAV